MMIFAIKSNAGRIWSRTAKAWVDPATMTESEARKACEFGSFKGCNQVAMSRDHAIRKDRTEWPQEWGRIQITEKRA